MAGTAFKGSHCHSFSNETLKIAIGHVMALEFSMTPVTNNTSLENAAEIFPQNDLNLIPQTRLYKCSHSFKIKTTYFLFTIGLCVYPYSVSVEAHITNQKERGIEPRSIAVGTKFLLYRTEL